MDKELVDYVHNRLEYARQKLNEASKTIYEIECTIGEEYAKKEESSIEDEFMSCLKDLINDNDLLKNLKIKIVKVDEDSE